MCLLALISLLLNQSPASADYGIGVHVGLDKFTIDEESEHTFSLINDSLVALSREEIADPYHFGVQIYIDDVLAALIDELDLSMDFSTKEYSFEFQNPNYQGSESQIIPESVKYSRISATISIKRYLLVLPPELETVRLYLGVGFGLQMISPVVTSQLIYDNLFTNADQLDLEDEDIIKKSSHASFLGVAGIRINPPMLPISVHIEGRYFTMGEWEYKQPTNFYSISIGLSYTFE